MMRMDIYEGKIACTINDCRDLYWFLDGTTNSICKYDSTSNIVVFLQSLQLGNAVFKSYKVFGYGDRLVFVGFGSPKVIIYNTALLQVEKYVYQYDTSTTRWHPFLFENCIYFIPKELNKQFYIFSLDSYSFEPTTVRNNPIEADMVSCYPCQIDDTIWIAASGTNYYYSLNLPELIVAKTELEMNLHLFGLLKTKDCLFFSQQDNDAIIQLSPRGTRVINDKKMVQEPFSRIIEYRQYIIACPRYADYFIIYDTIVDKHKIVHVEGVKRDPQRQSASLTLDYVIRDYDTITFLPWNTKELICLNLSDGRSWIETINSYNRKSFYSKQCLIENGSVQLDVFLMMVKHGVI